MMKKLFVLIGLVVFSHGALCAQKQVVGKYKCVGTVNLEIIDPIFSGSPSKSSDISGQVVFDKDGSFSLSITTSGYSNLIEGKLISKTASTVDVDVGNYSFDDLKFGRLPGALWYENKRNIESGCSCLLGAEFYASATGSRISNAKRVSLVINQEWRVKRSTTDRNYRYSLSCKK